MIQELEIVNGILELKFNEYTYNYTVKVNDDIEKLEFKYKLKDDVSANIRNNYINEDNNIVYLDVYDINNLITYTFYVYKDNTNLTSGIDNYKKSLEVVEIDPYFHYKLEGLCAGVFLCIVIVFSIIFRKKKIVNRCK